MLIVLLLIAAVCGKTLLGTRIFLTGGIGGADVIGLGYSARFRLWEDLRLGNFPWWTGDLFGGYPIHAEGQGGFLSPVTTLLFGVGPPVLAFGWLTATTLLVAAGGTCLAARAAGVSRAGSCLAAVTVMLSGFSQAHLQHVNLLQAAAWWPWLALACQRGSGLGAGAVVGLQMLAGFPQMAYLSGAGAAVVAMAAHRRRAARILAVAALLGLLIGAAQWLPTWHFSSTSVRSDGLSPESIWRWGYTWRDLSTFISPFPFGDPSVGTYARKESLFWENAGYVGMLVLILAGAGAVARRRGRPGGRPYEVGWMGLVVVGVGIALSGETALTRGIAMIIPGFKSFQAPQRAIWLAIFGLACLAGAGLAAVRDHVRKGLWKALAAAAIVAVSLDLFTTWRGWNPTISADYVRNPPRVVGLLRADPTFRRLAIGDGALLRLRMYLTNSGWRRPEGQADYRELLYPNTNLIWRIPVHGGDAPLVPRAFRAANPAKPGSPDAHAAAAQGVTHLLDTVPQAGPGVRLIARFPVGVGGRQVGEIFLHRLTPRGPLTVSHFPPTAFALGLAVTLAALAGLTLKGRAWLE